MNNYLNLNELKSNFGDNLKQTTLHECISRDMEEFRQELNLPDGLRVSHLANFMTDKFNSTLMKLNSIIKCSEKIETFQFSDLLPTQQKYYYAILNDMFNAKTLDNEFMNKSIWENVNHVTNKITESIHTTDKLKGFNSEFISGFVEYLHDLKDMLDNENVYEIRINELGFTPNLIDNKPVLNVINLDVVSGLNNQNVDVIELIANEINFVLKSLQDLHTNDGVIRITSIKDEIHMIEYITVFHNVIGSVICKDNPLKAYATITTLKTILKHN